MRNIPSEDLLQVVGCEIDQRPTDAPGIDEIAALVLGGSRVPGALSVRFPADARATVEAFAAAERQCCGGIGWLVEGGTDATLTISTNDTALDAIETMFAQTEV